MADKGDVHELIIIKRHDEEEHEHHSSAWKVAHADFMTAMMAFFLIMWLINVTDKDVRKAIASYFNPVNLAESMTEKKGLNDPEDLKPLGTSADGDQKSALKQTAGAGTGPGADYQRGDKDRSAFQDPYAVLSQLAGEADPADMSTPDAAVGETGTPGNTTGDATRDPFDPVYWQITSSRKLKTDKPGPQSLTPPTPGRPDAASTAQSGEFDANQQGASRTASGGANLSGANPASSASAGAAKGDAGKGEATKGDTARGDAAKGDVAKGEVARGASSPGDQQKGDQAKGDVPRGDLAKGETQKSDPTKAAQAPVQAQGQPNAAAGATPFKYDAASAKSLEADVLSAVQTTIGTAHAPHVDVRSTREGLVINITDDIDYSMFPVGSAVPDGRLVRAMEKISTALQKRPGEIVLRGFTDGRPYRSDTYDNWRLSTARAHMAYYMLVRGGLPEPRIVKIEGFADRSLKTPANPYAPENRRIEILLRVPS